MKFLTQQQHRFRKYRLDEEDKVNCGKNKPQDAIEAQSKIIVIIKKGISNCLMSIAEGTITISI
jgi:hypothetical protein